MNSVKTLFQVHLKQESRNVSHILGLLLLMWIVSYVVYRLIPQMDGAAFNDIFWIIVLLLSVNVTMRVENHHTNDEHFFFYMLVDPVDIILARICFNFLYLTLVVSGFFGFMCLYFSDLGIFNWHLISSLLIGTFTMSAVQSFVSAIGRYAEGQNTIISILSLPLLIPVILILSHMGDQLAIDADPELTDYLILVGISMLSISLSLLLFPFIWKR